jgi:hypothetical protein
MTYLISQGLTEEKPHVVNNQWWAKSIILVLVDFLGKSKVLVGI